MLITLLVLPYGTSCTTCIVVFLPDLELMLQLVSCYCYCFKFVSYTARRWLGLEEQSQSGFGPERYSVCAEYFVVAVSSICLRYVLRSFIISYQNHFWLVLY